VVVVVVVVVVVRIIIIINVITTIIIPGEHTRQVRNRGTAESSRTGHGTYTSRSADVNVQKKLTLEIALYAP
jgi:hypothetical protein